MHFLNQRTHRSFFAIIALFCSIHITSAQIGSVPSEPDYPPYDGGHSDGSEAETPDEPNYFPEPDTGLPLLLPPPTPTDPEYPSSPSGSDPETPTLTRSFTPLPNKVIVGYWHNWENDDAPFMKLWDVLDTDYNVVNVSFIETWKENEIGRPANFIAEGVHPKFTVYDGSRSQNLTYSDADFKGDVRALQAAGIPVLISIGGQNGHVEIRNVAEKDAYVQGVIDIVTEYNFDGIDIDYEGGSMTILNGPQDSIEYDDITDPELKFGIDAIREIKAHFGEGFIITAAPELAYVQEGRFAYPNSSQFIPFLHNIRNILDYIHVQYYNFGGALWSALDGKTYNRGDIDFVVAMTDMLITGFPLKGTNQINFPGLRPDQVALGFPCVPNAAGGVSPTNPDGYYFPPVEILKALNYLMKGEKTADMTYNFHEDKGPYPDLRGVMTWSINWDASNDGGTPTYEFANTFSDFYEGYNTPTDPLSPGKSWDRNDSFAQHVVPSDWGTGYSGYFNVVPNGLGNNVTIKAVRIYFRAPTKLPLRSYVYHVSDDLYYVERDFENRGEIDSYPSDLNPLGAGIFDYTGSGDSSQVSIEAFFYRTEVTNADGLRPVLEALPPDTSGIYFPDNETADAIIHRIVVNSGNSTLNYSLSGIADKPLALYVSNSSTLSASIDTNAKSIQLNGLKAGRSSIKLVHPDGAVRLIGVTIKDTDGSNPSQIPSYLGVGGVHENHNNEMDYLDEWDASNPLKQKWYDFHYSYIQGGTFSTIASWRTDATYDGERVSKLTRNALKRGAIPVYTWYNMVSDPYGDGDFCNALQDSKHMKEYFHDFKVFLEMAERELAGESCVIVLEPDQIGYLAQNQAAEPNAIPVPVSKAYHVGLLERGVDPDFENNVVGWVKAMNYAISKYLPNARFGWKANLWATRLGSTFPVPEKGICRSTDGLDSEAEVLEQRKKIYAEARAITSYYVDCGVKSHNADFIALDKYGWDGGRELNQEGLDHPEETKWLWNATHWVNYLTFTRGIHDESGLPICLWQLPMGHLDSTQTNNPWKPDGSFTDLANRGATFYEDSTISFFFGDTFREPDAQDKTYFLKAYGIADVSEDPAGDIVWNNHFDLVKEAGVEMMLFGHGLSDSTWGWYPGSNREASPPDDNFFNTKVQAYFQNLPADADRNPTGNLLGPITEDYIAPVDPDTGPGTEPSPGPEPEPEPEEPDAELLPNPNYLENLEYLAEWKTKGEWYNVISITIKNNSGGLLNVRNGVFLYESPKASSEHGYTNTGNISWPDPLVIKSYPTATENLKQYRGVLEFGVEPSVDTVIADGESFSITLAFSQLSQEEYDIIVASARFFCNNNLSPEYFGVVRIHTPAAPESSTQSMPVYLKSDDLSSLSSQNITLGETVDISVIPGYNYDLYFEEVWGTSTLYTPNYTEESPHSFTANTEGTIPEITLSLAAITNTPATVTVDLRWLPLGATVDVRLERQDTNGNDFFAANVGSNGTVFEANPGNYRLVLTNIKTTDTNKYYIKTLKKFYTFESDTEYTIGGITLEPVPEHVAPRWPTYLSMGTVSGGGVSQDPALTIAPIDCFFVYAGDGGNGDRGIILDMPLRATNNTLAQARRIEAVHKKNIIPVMVIYTAEYSGGNNENKDFEDDNLYKHYINLIRQVLAIQSNHDVDHPHAGSIVLNPDCLGVLQQGNLINIPPASGGTLGLTIRVKEQLARAIEFIVEKDGITTVEVPTSLTNDLKGWIQSHNFIMRQFGPNVTFGWQQNIWSTGDSLWVHSLTESQIDTQISTPLVNFMDSLEVYEGPWKPDFLVFDRYERDSFSDISRFNGYAYNNLDWQAYFTHIKQVSKKMGDIPIMLWQIPGGHMPVIGEDTGPYSLTDHSCSAAPYILGDPRIGTDLTKINPTVLNLNLPDPNKYGRQSPSTVKELLEVGEGYDWSTNHLQDLIDMNVFAILWGGGTTTSVGSIETNGDDNGWLAEKVRNYYLSPKYLIKDKAPTAITHNAKSVEMRFISIGDQWNTPKKVGSRPYGYVEHSYEIGDFEVTADQFAKVLSYDTRVGDGNESYWVDQGTGNLGTAPASKVSWLEAAKFCNWLTSGNAYNGVYQFDAAGSYLKTDRATAQANYTTIYALPTDDEWYKAACYTGNGYSDYTFGSSILPLDGVDANWGTLNSAWEVGKGITEQNKTYDLFGNLNEWLENSNDFEAIENWRGANRLIGPASYEGLDPLSFIPTNAQPKSYESETLGFRVVRIASPLQKTNRGTPTAWLDKYGLKLSGSGTLPDAEAELLDPDKDGLNNFNEYLFGTDPKNPQSNYFLKIEDGNLLDWETLPGRKYELQYSKNIVDGFQVLKSLPYTKDNFRDLTHPDETKLFYRLKVTLE